ncbi:MAG: amidohydrolase family protein, partial [Bacillota bacterium]
RARTLEADGVTTFLYTGATFEHPIPTLTGRVRTDIIYVDKVIGVGEVSLSELGPSLDSYGSGPQYIAKIAAEAVLSSRIAGKAGIICLQVPGGGRCLEPLFDVLEKTRLPISHFLPAHVNQNNVYFEQIIKFAKMGGTADLTSSYSPDAGFPQAIKPSKAARILLESGVPITRITMSTDGNGAHPYGDKDGRPAGSHYLAVSTLYSEFRDLVQAEGFALEDALRVLSTNQAGLMRMPDKKGAIKKGADADLLMIEKDLTLNKVFAKGRLMVDEGKPVVRGMFDESLYGV